MSEIQILGILLLAAIIGLVKLYYEIIKFKSKKKPKPKTEEKP
jgi:hypothetical protein